MIVRAGFASGPVDHFVQLCHSMPGRLSHPDGELPALGAAQGTRIGLHAERLQRILHAVSTVPRLLAGNDTAPLMLQMPVWDLLVFEGIFREQHHARHRLHPVSARR